MIPTRYLIAMRRILRTRRGAVKQRMGGAAAEGFPFDTLRGPHRMNGDSVARHARSGQASADHRRRRAGVRPEGLLPLARVGHRPRGGNRRRHHLPVLQDQGRDPGHPVPRQDGPVRRFRPQGDQRPARRRRPSSAGWSPSTSRCSSRTPSWPRWSRSSCARGRSSSGRLEPGGLLVLRPDRVGDRRGGGRGPLPAWPPGGGRHQDTVRRHGSARHLLGARPARLSPGRFGRRARRSLPLRRRGADARPAAEREPADHAVRDAHVAARRASPSSP